MENTDKNTKMQQSLKTAVMRSALLWWNSFTKAERRELRIKQLGVEKFWVTYSISQDEILELYKRYA